MSNEVVPCSMTMGLAVLSILAPEVTYEPAWPENAVYGNSADVEALNTSGVDVPSVVTRLRYRFCWLELFVNVRYIVGYASPPKLATSVMSSFPLVTVVRLVAIISSVASFVQLTNEFPGMQVATTVTGPAVVTVVPSNPSIDTVHRVVS